ncbi:hypothetical protein ACRALDRAFT_1061336 [Sodiomyces alcalophilus JCM 7366]|uniref:uncharacterized protein n=1 Tax=Sodiomyces alcalophilus JCM 7366 TaxID=591952 RepID=UPI0039B4EFF3
MGKRNAPHPSVYGGLVAYRLKLLFYLCFFCVSARHRSVRRSSTTEQVRTLLSGSLSDAPGWAPSDVSAVSTRPAGQCNDVRTGEY